jgi:putative N-acetylmannosamine-6-phosphate epimerase
MRRAMTTALLKRLRGGLVVSCQPVTGGPMDRVEIVVALALAARDGGAAGLRIEGAANVAAVRAACDLPILGLIKRDLADSPVRITPFLDDVTALADAGADVIAFDATDRLRPVPVADLLARTRRHGRLAMADCSTLEECTVAAGLGVDVVGTTMSGYTGGPVPAEPDLDLVRAAAARLEVPVVAEGRFNTPASAAAAIGAGAFCVVVGSAITRTEHVTGWFADAVAAAGAKAER